MNTHVLNYTQISFPIFGENFAFDVPGYITVLGFNIYLYALCITAGFCVAAIYVIKRRDALGLTRDNILDLVIMAVPFGLVGARIFYIAFNPGQYFGEGNWQNIFMLREGGLAVYGGIIFSGLAFIIYSRIKKIRIGRLLDAAAFGLFIGQSIGRWGNFFNREAFGVETGLPWRMGLATPSGVIYVHPAFLYESLWNAAGLLLLHIYSKKRKSGYPGQYFLLYVAWYGFGRFFIEGIRIDSLYIYGTDIRVSQLIAALSFAASVAILVRNHIRGPVLADEYPQSTCEDDIPEDTEEEPPGSVADNATNDEITPINTDADTSEPTPDNTDTDTNEPTPTNTDADTAEPTPTNTDADTAEISKEDKKS